MLYIRADANETIASGHIMRCLSIAQALRELGEESVFLIADKKPIFLLEEKGFPYICLDSDWQDKEGELDTLYAIIARRGITKLLVDSYQITERYMRELKKRVTLCYLDDMDISPEWVDLLICYTVCYRQMGYGSGYQGATELLLGPKYAPLRQEFVGRVCPKSPVVGNIFLTTGGADTYRISEALLRECFRRETTQGLQYHVIVGGFYDDALKTALYGMQREKSNILLYENIRNMAEVMSSCDIAVSAGGSTLLELCACGVPTVSFTYADNQLDVARCFQEQSILRYVGDARETYEGADNIVLHLVDEIQRLAADFSFRLDITQRMQRLVDGKGAMRIADRLQTL